MNEEQFRETPLKDLVNREGPLKIKIPMTFKFDCLGCKYHDMRMVRSGLDPVYRHDCTHPEAPKSPMKLSFTGNIGKTTDTPDWCPFLNRGNDEEGKK